MPQHGLDLGPIEAEDEADTNAFLLSEMGIQ